MRREVRANLIFIVVLVLLIAPGFVFLMKKKLNGSTRPNFMPDPAPHQIAYIQPLPAPPVQRVEPRKVRDWVRDLFLPRSNPAINRERVPMRGNTPSVVSDRFITQWIGLEEWGDGYHALLLHWDASNLAGGPKPIVAIDTASQTMQSQAVKIEEIKVPAEIRHTLQDVGYVDPPQRIWWIDAVLPMRPDGIKAIRLTTEKIAGRPVEEVLYLDNPATRPNIEVTP